jgi:hypothetical protein
MVELQRICGAIGLPFVAFAERLERALAQNEAAPGTGED